MHFGLNTMQAEKNRMNVAAAVWVLGISGVGCFRHDVAMPGSGRTIVNFKCHNKMRTSLFWCCDHLN